MDVWKGEESNVAVSFKVLCGWFCHPEGFIGLICFGSTLKQLAGVDRFRHLAGDRSCTKLYILLFD